MAASYPDLAGIWLYNQRQVLDDQAAIRMRHVSSDGKPLLHGTWTQMRHFVIRTRNDGAVLMIYDENGCFCHFTVVAGADEKAPSWVSQPVGIDFGREYVQPADSPSRLLFYPSLFVDAYDKSSCPSNMDPGQLYINRKGGDTLPRQPVSIPQQTVTYHPDNNTFYWSSDGHKPGLLFRKVTPAEGVSNELPAFGAPFTAQPTKYAQVDFPFYGFDPRYMTIFSAGGSFSTPGTPVHDGEYPSNPGQALRYPLIFKFPASDSRDYQQYPGLAGAPNLPLGRSGVDQPIKVMGEHSDTLSTVADRAYSYSSTIGLSAGAEKMLTVGVKSTSGSKAETQQKNESRYTIARTAKIYWADIIDAPSAELTAEFVSYIKDRTDSMRAKQDPDWASFVGYFGTHYMHAMTYGWLEYSETRFSLKAETQAKTTSSGLAVDAAATLQGATVKASAEVKQEWTDKQHIEVSDQDVQAFQMGSDDEVIAILFDLRPITELLNPLFFKYNPADPWQQLAPFVWSDVRASLDGYLRSLGLGDQQLDTSLLEDYTPRLVNVTFPKIWVTQEILQGDFPPSPWLAAGGTVTIADLDGDPSGPHDPDQPPDEQYHLSVTNLNLQGLGARLDGNGTALSASQLSCTLALRRSAKPHLKLTFNLGMAMQSTAGDVGSIENVGMFSGDQVIECEVTDTPVTQEYQPVVLQIWKGPKYLVSYTLHVQVRWEPRPWPPPT